MSVKIIGPWHVHAGGTGAAYGKHGYMCPTEIGEYRIDPYTTATGRHAGYLLRFTNSKGKLPGGLWQAVGKDGTTIDLHREANYRSPNEAKKAASLHYAAWRESQKAAGEKVAP